MVKYGKYETYALTALKKNAERVCLGFLDTKTFKTTFEEKNKGFTFSVFSLKNLFFWKVLIFNMKSIVWLFT